MFQRANILMSTKCVLCSESCSYFMQSELKEHYKVKVSKRNNFVPSHSQKKRLEKMLVSWRFCPEIINKKQPGTDAILSTQKLFPLSLHAGQGECLKLGSA